MTASSCRVTGSVGRVPSTTPALVALSQASFAQPAGVLVLATVVTSNDFLNAVHRAASVTMGAGQVLPVTS